MSDQLAGERFPAVEPYTALAAVYDLVMAHVDYAEWAAYVDSLLETFGHEPEDVLELGCGTGRMARELCGLRYLRYVASDRSPEMIRIARMAPPFPQIQFLEADFRDFSLDRRFDLALLLYDGVNYLLEEEEISGMLSAVRRHVRPDGLLIFDQSTPSNSLNNRDYFGDYGGHGDLSYVRRSGYDEEAGLHHTTFDIVTPAGSFSEHHIQRAYGYDQIRALISEREWAVVAALDGFTEEPATDESERIHWILRAT